MEAVISLVIPVYRNADSIPELLEALDQLNRRFAGDLEAVFVVDGSPDESLAHLNRALPGVSFRSQLLSLSRNFGAFGAIRAGMTAARGEYVAVMAADLQEPPDLVERFYEQLETGRYDVAIGQRTGRQDPGLSRLAAATFWKVYRRFVQPEFPPGGVDVFACTRVVRDHLVELNESSSSLIALLFWVGFRRVFVPYERRARQTGKSSWTFAKKLRYLSDSIFSFSDLPIRLLMYSGLLGLVASMVLGVVVVTAKLAGDIPVPGYAATVFIVSFFGALNCFGLGLIGGYVWRSFENTKLRPNFIIAQSETFDAKTASDAQ